MTELPLTNKEYNVFYKTYIDKASPYKDCVLGLKQNLGLVVSFFENIPIEKHDYSYAKGKWSIKDVLLHMVDTERVFAYRALCIAREDKTPLPGFEQDAYVANANANGRTLSELIEEYKAVRLASIALFGSFSQEAMLQLGEASGFPVSVRALGFIITGHENHHLQVLRERYLKLA